HGGAPKMPAIVGARLPRRNRPKPREGGSSPPLLTTGFGNPSVHDFEVRIHRTVAALLALRLCGPALRRRSALPASALGRSRLLVHRGRRLVPHLLERLGRRGDRGRVLALQRVLEPAQARLDARLERRVELRTVLLQVLLHLVCELVAAIARLDLLLALLVLAGVLLRVLHHLLDVALAEPARRLDPDA